MQNIFNAKTQRRKGAQPQPKERGQLVRKLLACWLELADKLSALLSRSRCSTNYN